MIKTTLDQHGLHLRASLVAAALIVGVALLAGCTSGSSSPMMITPAPTPPAPPPPATYMTIISPQADQIYDTAAVHMEAWIDGQRDVLVPPAKTTLGVTATPPSVTAPSTTTSAQYSTIHGYSFGPPSQTMANNYAFSRQDSSFTYYNVTLPAGLQTNTTLKMLTPGSSNTLINLSYSSYGEWETLCCGTQDIYDWTVFGFSTQVSDMPRTGTATYQTIVDGVWFAPPSTRTVSGSAGLTADFGAGTTQLTLNLSGTDIASRTVTVLGGFSGQGTIAGASFTGPLVSTNAASAGYSGSYGGRFFGPGAAEAGAVFQLSNGSGGVVGGAVIGHK
jgi:hypothetical protein